MSIINITDKEFETEVMQSNVPVLVDFWAEWCGPCKRIAPILEEIAQEKKDQIKIAKIDIDSNNEISYKYGVKGIPTLMFFKNQTLIDTKVGASSKESINEWINSLV